MCKVGESTVVFLERFLIVPYSLGCELRPVRVDNTLKWINSYSLWIVFWNHSQRIGFSPRSLGHLNVLANGVAQEAGAGGRSGAVSILVRGSLMIKTYLDERLKRREEFQNTIRSASKFIYLNMNIGPITLFLNWRRIFRLQVTPVETTDRLARTHIEANAYRINRFEYPFYEQVTDMRVKRSQLLLQMYKSMQHNSARMHAAENCAWQKLLDPAVACNCTTAPQVSPLKFEGCELAPVIPRQHERCGVKCYVR